MPHAASASFDIGPPRDEDEALLFVDTFSQALMGAAPPQPDWSQAWLQRTGAGNIRLARRNGRPVGGLVLLRMGQFFGGRSVPMTGISAVAIRPEHRASGAASALLRSVLSEIRLEGTALSGLYPATQPVYRRAGYEIAGSRVLYRIPTRSLALKARPLEIRAIGPDDPARLRKVYAAFARSSAGLLDRIEWSWARVLSAPDGSLVHAYVAERDGEIEGYLAYVQRPLVPIRYEIHVKDLVALTRDAATSLLSFLGDHRSIVPSVLYHGAPADPLLLLPEEQEWSVETRWDWMLRVVDVAKAFAERGFPAGLSVDLHLDATDDVVTSNSGRWRVAIADGRAEASRGGRGRIKLHVRALASLYSGWASARELARVGLVEGSDRELAALSAAFAGPAPWMPDMF